MLGTIAYVQNKPKVRFAPNTGWHTNAVLLRLVDSVMLVWAQHLSIADGDIGAALDVEPRLRPALEMRAAFRLRRQAPTLASQVC